MGCASSSPLINGGGPGGVVESAKEAATKTATDVLHAGETAIHDVGEHVKEAVQNVTHELENVLGGGKKADKSNHINEDDQPMANGHGDEGDPASKPNYQIIRLKGSKQNSVEETELMENMKNDMISKAPGVGDDTDRMADELMKETEDMLRDAETGIAHHEMTTRITSSEDGTIEILNLEEPEIERILAAGAGEGEHAPDSPQATLNTLTVPASEASRTGKDEAMPLGASGQPEDKPDVKESAWGTPQVSLDGESVASSDGGQEHFRSEVLKATATHTPGGVVVRRPNAVNRPPPPSTAHSERMQRFIFKLNSIILSDIEEWVCGEDGIVRQLERDPDKVLELYSKSSVEEIEVNTDQADGGNNEDVAASVTDDTAPGNPNTGTLRRQHSISVEGDGHVEPGDSLYRDTSWRSEAPHNEQDHELAIQLKDIPPAVRLRALMRFKSFDGFEQESHRERNRDPRHRWMKSLDAINVTDAREEEQNNAEPTEENGASENPAPEDYGDLPYDPEDEERICEALLAELRAFEAADRADDAKEVHHMADAVATETLSDDEQMLQDGSGPKTAWEKLQDYLQRVPKKRSSNYDLFHDSEDGTLATLFKRHKMKQLFHYSDSSSGSSDAL